MDEKRRKAFEDAWHWVMARYNLESVIPKPIIRWTHRVNSSFFIPRFPQMPIPVILAGRLDGIWSTYALREVGCAAVAVKVRESEELRLIFVHELTHFAQILLEFRGIRSKREHRKYEVEATENEIAYAKEHYPHLYAQLSTLPPKRESFDSLKAIAGCNGMRVRRVSRGYKLSGKEAGFFHVPNLLLLHLLLDRLIDQHRAQ